MTARARSRPARPTCLRIIWIACVICRRGQRVSKKAVHRADRRCQRSERVRQVRHSLGSPGVALLHHQETYEQVIPDMNVVSPSLTWIFPRAFACRAVVVVLLAASITKRTNPLLQFGSCARLDVGQGRFNPGCQLVKLKVLCGKSTYQLKHLLESFRQRMLPGRLITKLMIKV